MIERYDLDGDFARKSCDYAGQEQFVRSGLGRVALDGAGNVRLSSGDGKGSFFTTARVCNDANWMLSA